MRMAFRCTVNKISFFKIDWLASPSANNTNNVMNVNYNGNVNNNNYNNNNGFRPLASKKLGLYLLFIE